MTDFRDRAQQLARTAQRFAELQRSVEESEVLRTSTARLIETGSDNWAEGTDFFTLTLEVPIEQYAVVEAHRDQLEKSILRRVKDLTRTESGVAVTEVVIAPQMYDGAGVGLSEGEQQNTPAPNFWTPGHFRLFLSHPSQIKSSVHKLKDALVPYQIAAFVAHDDIEPTKEWEAEIDSALRTMDALAALLSPDFLPSKWCDQEAGIAIGRGKLVVPIRLGADPHGFLGKYQGIPAKGQTVSWLAQALVTALAKHPQSSTRMADALIERMANAGSWDSAKTTMTNLELVPGLNSVQSARLLATLDENSQVGNAFGVADRIHTLISRSQSG